MSRVPMMFRDWWDDWETPSRASRVIDSHFGSGLRRDDLLSSWAGAASPSSLRGGYYRPWKNTAVQRQDSGSTINSDKEKFQIILDVAQFEPAEITVKTTDKFIVVEGKHEEKQDEHGYVSRQFIRRYCIPEGHDQNDVSSSLSSDGVLTIVAPKKAIAEANTERSVPIQKTGPVKEATPAASEQPKVEQPN